MFGQTVWMLGFQANTDEDHSPISCWLCWLWQVIKTGVVKLSVANNSQPSEVCERSSSHQQFTISIIIVLVHIVLVHISMALLLLLLLLVFH